MSDQDYENTIAHLDERIDQLEAARLAYASEFDGDVGSIHENIRKLKAVVAELKQIQPTKARSFLDRYEEGFDDGWNECVEYIEAALLDCII